MDTTDFDLEFYSKTPDQTGQLEAEAKRRFERLRAGHTDIIGASVALEQPTHSKTAFLHQVRVIAYMRPDNIVAVEKRDTAEGALKGALKAVERQVRERRKQLKERWKRPEEADNMSLYALSPRELYDTYAEEAGLAELLDRERVDIARGLMLQKGLDPRAAHYVADQMLRYAQEMGEAQQS